MSDQHDFYIGYQVQAKPGIRRFLAPRIAAGVVLAVGLAALLSAAQDRFAFSYFQFGETRKFSGFVSEFPYPSLLVERPGKNTSLPYSRYLLSAPGKFGVADLFAGKHGQRVSLSGTLIYRDDQTMVEVVPASIVTDEQRLSLSSPQSLGRFTLRGEIVDSKCYLGVMKPGDEKPHRACAIRCISGGIPPVFVARNETGDPTYLLLAGSDGRAINKEILDLIAEPLEIDGEVLRLGSDLILQAEPDQLRRLTQL